MKSWIKGLLQSRLWVFLLVGSINTLIGYALFAVAYQVVGLNYNIALMVAYALGTVIAYVNHRRVTFKSSTGHRQAFSRFVATYALIYLLNASLLIVLTESTTLHPLLGQAVCIVVVTIVSFGIQRAWVFKS